MSPKDVAVLGAVMTEQGKHDEAEAVLERSASIERNLDTLAMMGYLAASRGNRKRALEIRDAIIAESANGESHLLKLAQIYASLGDRNKAYEALDQALIAREVDFPFINCDPRLKAIRSDERFKVMLRKIGLRSFDPD